MEQQEQHEYLRFNPAKWVADMKMGISVMCIAPRNTGKTYLVTDFIANMQNVRNWDEAYLFSLTAKAQTDAYRFIPESNRFDHLALDEVNKIFDKQEKMREQLERHEIEKPTRILIIADDVITTKEARQGDFNKMFSNGRHYYIDCFALSQTLKGFAPTARSNSDLVITWRPLKYDDRKGLIDDYLSVQDGRRTDVSRECTEVINEITSVPYRAVVIIAKLALTARHCSDYVRWYLADPKGKQPNTIGEDKPQSYRTETRDSFVYDPETQQRKEAIFTARIRQKTGKKTTYQGS